VYVVVRGTVDGAGGAGLRLHLDDVDGRAEDVLAALGGPLVDVVGHGAGRRDRVDARDLGERVRYVRGRLVAVHGFELTSHILSFINSLGTPMAPGRLLGAAVACRAVPLCKRTNLHSRSRSVPRDCFEKEGERLTKPVTGPFSPRTGGNCAGSPNGRAGKTGRRGRARGKPPRFGRPQCVPPTFPAYTLDSPSKRTVGRRVCPVDWLAPARGIGRVPIRSRAARGNAAVYQILASCAQKCRRVPQG